jgi:L-asparaginase
MGPMTDLPRLVVLATGGTIAGAGDTPEGKSYRSAALSVDALLDAVPQVRELAELEGEQIAQVGSQDLTSADWLDLARRARVHLARDVDGLIVTHGTDTLEETAFFLDLVLDAPQPVVVTGAMRPATGLSADGPRNLLDSVRVALDPAARGRGVLVLMDESIHKAQGVTKTNTSSVSAFQSPNRGAAGAIVGGHPVFFRRARPREERSMPDLEGLAELPRVDVLYACAGMSPDLVTASLDAGARGLVLAGVGNGNGPGPVIEALTAAVAAGVPVVRSTRSGSGFVARDVEIDDSARGFVAAGSLGPAKARVLLAVSLLKTSEAEELQECFFAQ